MKNIWNVALWKTRWMFKEKSTWINLFILPIVFALIFGGMQSDNPNKDALIKVGMVNGNTQVSEEILTDVLAHQLTADMVSFTTKDKAVQALKNGDISALVFWPKNFEKNWVKGEKTPWTLVYEKQTSQNFLLEQNMQQLMVGLNAVTIMGKNPEMTASEQVDKWLTNWQHYRDSNISVEVQYGKQEGTSAFSRVFVGFAIMFLMFALNQSASTILEEKEIGTWQRMLIAPLKKSQLLIGNILHFLLLGLTQFIVLMIFTSIVFKVNWGHYLDTLIFTGLIILTVSGLGFMLATIVKTKAQQNVLGSVVITVSCMLGGVYWPLSFVSATMRKIGNFVPQKWAMDGLMELMSGGYRLFDVMYSVEILLLFLIVFYTIAFIRIRKI